MKKTTLALLALLPGLFSLANVSLPRLFSDHLILQRNKPIPVWGWAAPGEKISVQFHSQTKTTRAGRDGKWSLSLDPEQAGGPYTLIVKGKNLLTIQDVLVGVVWICSGQSNMEWQVKNANNAAAEIAAANFPMIHHFLVTKEVSSSPRNDVKGGDWQVCSPATAGEFTAVGYYFARELYNQLHIPVGLIHTSWGGTHSETWTSREAFESSEEFRSMISKMPNLNLDSLAALRVELLKQKLAGISKVFSSGPTDVSGWSRDDFDDSQWPAMNLPSLWEQRGLDDLDGTVWFRRQVEVAPADAGKPAVLELAMVDDNDVTYVNGTKVGATNAYNEKRKYNIPAGVLKAGRNLIALRADDTGGGGGVWGEASDMKLTIDGQSRSLAGDWRYNIEAIGRMGSIGPNDYPTLLYNAMLHPLIPYAIEGAIWYQGESNAGRAYQYRKAFPLMITDWRQRWKQGDFPFYFVQLASFNSDNGDSKHGSTWAELREAQTMTLSLPNTGMAVTTDIGESKDIHPRNKQDVGRRLAAVALHQVYSQQNEYSGPMYESVKIEGNKAVVHFTHLGGGLVARDKYGYLKGFEIAGSDHQFHYAKALIQGDQVVVFCEDVPNPVAVRFGWADDAGENNLFNKAGFPASPFRTDNWKGITEEARFTIGR